MDLKTTPSVLLEVLEIVLRDIGKVKRLV